MNNLRTFLLKLIPEEDKLQHFYLGSLGAICFNLFLQKEVSALIITILAIGWELYRYKKYNYPIDLKDIFYSILTGYLLLL